MPITLWGKIRHLIVQRVSQFSRIIAMEELRELTKSSTWIIHLLRSWFQARLVWMEAVIVRESHKPLLTRPIWQVTNLFLLWVSIFSREGANCQEVVTRIVNLGTNSQQEILFKRLDKEWHSSIKSYRFLRNVSMCQTDKLPLAHSSIPLAPTKSNPSHNFFRIHSIH